MPLKLIISSTYKVAQFFVCYIVVNRVDITLIYLTGTLCEHLNCFQQVLVTAINSAVVNCLIQSSCVYVYQQEKKKIPEVEFLEQEFMHF